MVASVEATAAARDASCTEILSEVCQPLKTLAKEKTQERQERLKEVAQLRAELHKHGLTFEKVLRLTQNGVMCIHNTRSLGKEGV